MNPASIKIPAELFALAESSHFEGEAELPLLAAGPDDYAFAEPLRWEVQVTNTGQALLLEGTVSGTATCACARCLEDVTLQLEGEIEGYFLIAGEEAQASDDADDEGEEVGADELDVLPADHIIDLMPLISAALVIATPTVPLCREDCAGLCPHCGADLNEGPCGCGGDEALAEFDRAANPFSVLVDFKFDD